MAITESGLNAILTWRLLLQQWALDGSLEIAAQEALMLEGTPEVLQNLISEWSAGNFESLPPVELLPAITFPSAHGGYAIGTNTIYLNDEWLASAANSNLDSVHLALTEGLGHYLDAAVNAFDTAGDEGRYFASLLKGKIFLDKADRLVLRALEDNQTIQYGNGIASESIDLFAPVLAQIALDTDASPAQVDYPYSAIHQSLGYLSVIINGIEYFPDGGFYLTDGGLGYVNEGVEIAGNELILRSYAGSSGRSVLRFKITYVEPTGAVLANTVSATVDFLSFVEPPVVDYNEAPTDITLTTSGTLENSPAGTVIGSLSANDPDAGSTLTYELVAGDGTNDADNDLVEIVGNEVRVKTGASIDFETNPTLNLNIQVTDNGTPGLTFTKAVTAAVTDVNEAPTDITLTTSGTLENSPAGTVIGSLSANDPDAGSTFTYELVAGDGTNDADNDLVEIVGNEVRVKTGASIDFETNPTLNLRIQVTDNGTPGLTYTKAVTAAVTDVNKAPTDITLTTSGTLENSPAGTVIGSLSANDPDAGSTFTYELVAGDGTNDADNDLVEIVGNEVRVKTGASIDFETNPTLNLRIQVTDNGTPGLTYTKAVTAAVTDVNKAPTDITLTTSGTLENSPAGTVIGSLSANDPDAGSTFTYELVAGDGTNDADNDLVEIVGNEVRVKTGASIDFETNPTLNLNIQVTDNGTPGLTFTKAVTASVLDVNETPVNPLFTIGVSTSNATPIVISNYSDPGVQSNSVTPLGTGSGASVEQITTTRVNTGTKRKPKWVNQTSYTLIDRFTDVDGITFTAGDAANTISAQGVAGDNQRPAFDGQLIVDGGLNADTITGGSYRNWLVGAGIFAAPQTKKTTAVDTLIGTMGALDVYDLRTSDFTADAYSALNTGSARITNYAKGEDYIVLSGAQDLYRVAAQTQTSGGRRNRTTLTIGYQIYSGSELVATITPASGTTFTGTASRDLSMLYGQTGDPTQTLINEQQMFFG